MAHLMLDFETLGTAFNTAVVSLGGCVFNKEGIHTKRLWTFELDSQIKAGRSITGSTLCWWMKQSDSARSVFNDKAKKFTLAEFVTDFESFIDDSLKQLNEGRDELKPWGNGANFDPVIIEDIIRNVKGRDDIPWKFWNVWCFRTFDNLTKCKSLHKRVGVHHNAMDDAVYQAECVLAYWKKLEAAKGAK